MQENTKPTLTAEILDQLLESCPFHYLVCADLRQQYRIKKSPQSLVAHSQTGIYYPEVDLVLNSTRFANRADRKQFVKDLNLGQMPVYDVGQTKHFVKNRKRNKQKRNHLLAEIKDHLAQQPFHTMPWDKAPISWDSINPSELQAEHGVIGFRSRQSRYGRNWVALPDQLEAARQHARQTDAPPPIDLPAWQQLQVTLKLKSPKQGSTNARTIILKNSRTARMAAREIGTTEQAVLQAMSEKMIPSFLDPSGTQRVLQRVWLRVLKTPIKLAAIRRKQGLTPNRLGKLLGWPTNIVQAKLKRARINPNHFCYADAQAFFGLPDDPATIHIPATLRANAPTLFTFTQLRERGWTAKLITTLLGEPALTRPNPYYRNSPPKKLYLSDEAIAIEATPQFQAHWQKQQEKRARRVGTPEYFAAEQERLRQQLLAVFPTWHDRAAEQQQIVIHEGPTNAGKTYHALQALMTAQSGWYLAPLRLLAYEVYEQINALGIPCDLVTGEEIIRTPHATFTAATIEMFNPTQSGDCVIIDEAQMLGDPQRGWAWTRALMESRSAELHLACAPSATQLIQHLLDTTQASYEITTHERLCPITVAESAWDLNSLPAQTILVAFSRRMVWELTGQLESRGRRVSLIYGDLPPAVRHRQAAQFAAGETDICVATDAIAMGLNLPAQHVCFYEIEKFDGQVVRRLRTPEIQQIGGRAGRFGKHESGIIGATSTNDLAWLTARYYSIAPDVRQAYLSPTAQELASLDGSLVKRLQLWATLRAIPTEFTRYLSIGDLTEPLERAHFINQASLHKLGMEAALALLNAPAGQGQMHYWQTCLTSLINDQSIPLPDLPYDDGDGRPPFDDMIRQVKEMDLYLWLAHRNVFQDRFPTAIVQQITATRTWLTNQIHDALAERGRRKAQQKHLF